MDGRPQAPHAEVMACGASYSSGRTSAQQAGHEFGATSTCPQQPQPQPQPQLRQQPSASSPAAPAPTADTCGGGDGSVADAGSDAWGLPVNTGGVITKEYVSALFNAIRKYRQSQTPKPQPQHQRHQQLLESRCIAQQQTGRPAPLRPPPADLMPPPPPPMQQHQQRVSVPQQVPMGVEAGSRGLGAAAAATASAATTTQQRHSTALRQAPLPPRPVPPVRASPSSEISGDMTARQVSADDSAGHSPASRPLRLSDATFVAPPMRPPPPPTLPPARAGAPGAPMLPPSSLPSRQGLGGRGAQQAVSGAKRSSGQDVAMDTLGGRPSQSLQLPQPQQARSPQGPQSDAAAALAAFMDLLRQAQQHQQQSSLKRQKLVQ
ncbi:hypothetical protein HYH02_003672 [Chlamydomonas schloesseri]|uniref:Uncharacterized protein n=1 Tax=Chlamydomonas schloesseri TaxID=2026947 RepID=A0A836B9M1_9CHLO|nr:hypothetical protein HYH02_003672 [Chlamydomonas schloesseri]|eukprot:KAG2451897.1 hypothetical protein HYH02_003672 [Chlamydomonas schloesseri]